jgi:hypothetical protein
MPILSRWTATLAAAACLVTTSSLAAAPQAPPPAPAATPASLAPTPEALAYLDAVRKGDLAAIEKALAAGVAVDTPFRYNRTALSFAADRGSVEVVKLLLAKGANPDATDTFYNQSALGWASSPAQTRKPEHAEVVKVLLEKGAKGRERALGAAIGAGDVAMTQAILGVGGLSPALLSETLAAAKKGPDTKPEIVAALEKAGATMPVVASLSPAQLARYAGTYHDGQTAVTLAVKDGVVVASVGGQTLPLSPRSETTFAIEGRAGAMVTFTMEGDTVSSLSALNQAGTPTVYKRVTP